MDLTASILPDYLMRGLGEMQRGATRSSGMDRTPYGTPYRTPYRATPEPPRTTAPFDGPVLRIFSPVLRPEQARTMGPLVVGLWGRLPIRCHQFMVPRATAALL